MYEALGFNIWSTWFLVSYMYFVKGLLGTCKVTPVLVNVENIHNGISG